MDERLKKIPVIALKNKNKEDRYLSNGLDAGDWSDEDLDVHINDIEDAFLIWRQDLSKPDESDIEDLRESSRKFKEFMINRFGENASIGFDVDLWLEHYEPVNLEITKEQLEISKRWNE